MFKQTRHQNKPMDKKPSVKKPDSGCIHKTATLNNVYFPLQTESAT